MYSRPCTAANPSTFLQPKSNVIPKNIVHLAYHLPPGYSQLDSEGLIYAKLNSKDKHSPPEYFKFDVFEIDDEPEEANVSDNAFAELNSQSEFKELDLKELKELEQEKRCIEAAITIQRIWRGAASRKISGWARYRPSLPCSWGAKTIGFASLRTEFELCKSTINDFKKSKRESTETMNTSKNSIGRWMNGPLSLARK